MIEVNLLSEEKQQRVSRQRVDPTKPLLFVAFIVIFAAVALIDLYLHSKATAIKSEIKHIKADMNTPKFVESLKQANTLQFELDRLNRKAVIFDDLVTNRIHWSKKLAALEILVGTPAIQALIREGKTQQILPMMEAGQKYGMQTMNRCLLDLYLKRTITHDTAMRVSQNRDDLTRMIEQSAGMRKQA